MVQVHNEVELLFIFFGQDVVSCGLIVRFHINFPYCGACNRTLGENNIP